LEHSFWHNCTNVDETEWQLFFSFICSLFLMQFRWPLEVMRVFGLGYLYNGPQGNFELIPLSVAL